jgi:hypothetical protein
LWHRARSGALNLDGVDESSTDRVGASEEAVQ